MAADSAIRLVAFDMEGCLTADPTVWEIMHRKLGTWESHGLVYWRRYLAGEFDYDRFARMDVAVWRGASAQLLHDSAREVPLMPGCAEVLRQLRQRGIATAIISNGLACVVRRFERDFGLAHVHANDVLIEHDRLTGEVELRVPYGAKGEVLQALSARLGLGTDQIAAVGDSRADIAMFAQARLSVAFCPADPAVARAATHILRQPDLRPVLEIIRRAD